jgi:lipopolysaccharide export system protein LptC
MSAAPASLSFRVKHFFLGVLPMYGPLLLMGLLALGTWWLVQRTPVPEEARRPAAAAHVPDYDMHGFSAWRFRPEGPLVSVIAGAALRHFPDTDTVEIDHLRARAVDAAGQRFQARANQGVADQKQSQIELRGDAQVVRLAPGDGSLQSIETAGREMPLSDQDLVMRGQVLVMNTQTHDVSSDEPVTVNDAQGWVRGGAMRYRDAGQIAWFTGGVHGQLVPQARAASAAR